MWFLARMYDAQQALQMGLVNTVVPLDQLETETLVWCVHSVSHPMFQVLPNLLVYVL